MGLRAKLGLPETHFLFPFTSPGSFALARSYALDEHRKEHKLAPGDLAYKVVDVNGVRLYLVIFAMAHMKGVAVAWQNPGIGISIRLAESLLPHLGGLTEVACDAAGEDPPATSYLAEGEAHGKLRERITGLLKRAAIDEDKIRATVDDVFLYNSGMAAIYYLANVLLAYRPAAVGVLGSIFHNTLHHFEEKSPHGYQHFPGSGEAGLDALEAWLDEDKKKEGRGLSFLLVEFPSNPLIASADLKRLKSLVRRSPFFLAQTLSLSAYSFRLDSL